MRVLIINAIVYTSETKDVPRVQSIKDSMIYDLCLAFTEQGHEVVLYAAKDYQPIRNEEYPFDVIWAECFLPSVFMPHRLPVLKGLATYIRNNKGKLDLILTSEVFSINSLIATQIAGDQTIVWHELALHNRMMKKLPSRFWYNIIARIFMKKVLVVARSQEARRFISRYCKNVSQVIVEHGVNLDKFPACAQKCNSFVVCSQLIARKRIDGILSVFSRYLQKYDNETVLYVIGDGEERERLEKQVKENGMEKRVVFTGKLPHEDMKAYLMQARALLVNTIQDNSMISIIEAIAVGTPIVTTDVPLNCSYILKHDLGIVKPIWTEDDLYAITQDNEKYVENCLRYREQLSTQGKVAQFVQLIGESKI